MHSAVLQNKKYIKFADRNTVEVIALGSLERGVKAHDRRAATYKAKGPDGQVVERMVEWPSLTYEQLIALDRSKAARYNTTGKIPYTSIVDPWTEQELGRGYRSAKSIREAVKGFLKELRKAHGKGLTRKHLRQINKALVAVRKSIKDQDYAKALDILKKVSPKKSQSLPKAFTEKLAKSRAETLTAAQEALDQVRESMASNPKLGLRRLRKLMGRLRGTGLIDKARALLKEAAGN